MSDNDDAAGLICGKFEPGSEEQHRCSRPVNHPAAHWAEVDGKLLATWGQFITRTAGEE